MRRSADRPPASTPEEAQAALLEYALRALSQRALSVAELRARLVARQADEEQIDRVLSRLGELNYLDDRQVARREGQKRGVGAYRVQARLKQRGIDDETIRQTLQERDPAEELKEARALLERRQVSLLRGSNPRARAYGLLARRGYGSGVIGRALDGWPSADAGESWPPEEPSEE